MKVMLTPMTIHVQRMCVSLQRGLCTGFNRALPEFCVCVCASLDWEVSSLHCVQTCSVALELVFVLVDLNCEDVMLALVFQ